VNSAAGTGPKALTAVAEGTYKPTVTDFTSKSKDASGGDLQLGEATHVDRLDCLPRHGEVLVGLVQPTLLGKDARQQGGEVSGARPLPRSLEYLQTRP